MKNGSQFVTLRVVPASTALGTDIVTIAVAEIKKIEEIPENTPTYTNGQRSMIYLKNTQDRVIHSTETREEIAARIAQANRPAPLLALRRTDRLAELEYKEVDILFTFEAEGQTMAMTRTEQGIFAIPMAEIYVAILGQQYKEA